MKKLLLMLTLSAVVVFAVASANVAVAQIGENIPHGGYSASTDVCLQCHDVHEADASDYVLMRWGTVSDTCGSCHNLYQSAPGTLPGYSNRSPAGEPGTYTGAPAPAYDPGYPGTEATPGAAAPFIAYKVPYGTAGTSQGHRLGNTLSGTINYADGASAPAPSDYIPGGTGGLTAYAQINYSIDYPNTTGASSYSATAGLYCASCHTPHGKWGKMLSESNTGAPTFILSSRPNHGASDVTITTWLSEGYKFCVECHDKRMPGPDNLGTVHYNHPPQFCLDCHGDYVGQTGGAWPPTNVAADPTLGDFPHTGSSTLEIANILSAFPDELCIQCHTQGSLP